MQVMADLMGTEAAMVRVSISSAAHAMACALWAVVKPGATILVATGTPHGQDAEVFAELADWGVRSFALPLRADGSVDLKAIAAAMRSVQPDAVLLQRRPQLFAATAHSQTGELPSETPAGSHGAKCLAPLPPHAQAAVQAASAPKLAHESAHGQHMHPDQAGAQGCMKSRLAEARDSAAQPRQLVPTNDIAAAIRVVRAESRSKCSVVVDNSGAELLDNEAMGALGADAVTGSMLGHLGGGLAPEGGYVAGGRELVERACARLCAPGLSLDAGSVPGATQRKLFQGAA